MKKLNKFRVIKHARYEKCEVKTEYYTIEEEKKSFFGYKYWSEIKEESDCMGDSYKIAMNFTSEALAVHAIKNLQMGNKPDGWTEEVISVLDFNK